MKSPKYSIVVPVYVPAPLEFKIEKFTKPLVQSIIDYSDDFELILSINGSSQKILSELTVTLNDPRISVIWHSEPLGFSKAVNCGLRAARGSYSIILNDDIILLQQPKNLWLDILTEQFTIDRRLGVTGILEHSAGNIPDKFLVGFCLCISDLCLKTVGFLDESFGTGGFEDADYTYRARQYGFTTQVVGNNTFPLYHEGGVSVKTTENWENKFHGNLRMIEKRYMENYYL